MKLSVVTTMYHSAPHLQEFYACMAKTVEIITSDYEIVFVNDGSPDDSLNTALSIREKDNKVKIIDLSRNFEHHKAMMTGLSFSKGDLVFLIDCDLEEEPEWLGLFYKQFLNEENCDVIYGQQKKRKGSLYEQMTGAIFYIFFNSLSNFKIPHNLTTARLMTRRYVDSLLKFTERELFLAGVWQITGYRQVPMKVVKLSRGKSTYTFSRKTEILINSVVNFSDRPLRFIFYSGLVITLFAFLYIIYIVIARFFLGQGIEGWTSLIASVWLLGGIIISFLGIIGIYISNIYVETKNRPYTIVRAVYGIEQDAVK